MIEIDGNRKTFRSNVKSRAGKRLPGMEMYLKGVELKETNIAHGALPIIARDGIGYRHHYDETQAVYVSVIDEKKAGLEKIIDLFLDIVPSTSSFITGESDFTNLVGQQFRIYNPEYEKDNTVTQYWNFRFTSTVGVDPRLVYQNNGLYDGYTIIGTAGYPYFNNSMQYHLLRPFPRSEKHVEFETANDLSIYGEYDANSGTYSIPLGFPTTPFPANQPEQDPNSLPPNPTTIDVANYDLSDPAIYELLAQNAYWLYAIVTRSLYNVLPAEFFEILEPSQNNGPYVTPAEGANTLLWDVHQLYSPTTVNTNPLRVKLKYRNEMPDTNPSNNTVSANSDITLENWDNTRVLKWAKEGHRVLPKQNNVFYEGYRTDWLKQTFSRPQSTDANGVTSVDIKFYPPTRSRGSTVPVFSTGQEISKYEESLASNVPASYGEIQSEVIEIRKTQQFQTIRDSYESEFTYYEDVHYHDPDEQRWSNMQARWPQWIKESDHASPSEAFVEHVRNLIDYRYSPVRLIPEAPMSGRIDIFDHIRSFYSNMPETVLWNTKKSTSVQSHELDAITICKDTYLKKSEELDIKKFEDVVGKRDEGSPTKHVIKVLKDDDILVPNAYGIQGNNIYLPAGIYTAVGESWTNLGTFQTVIRYADATVVVGFSTFPDGVYPPDGFQSADIVYVTRTSERSPGDSVMFEDYFDQEEPSALDVVEEERWTRIDDEMMVWLTQRYWDHDSDVTTSQVQTGRNIEIDRREWQQSDYLYTNTGHTTVHFQRVNGIVSQEHKR